MILLQPNGSSQPAIDYYSNQSAWWHMEVHSLPWELGHVGCFKMTTLAMPCAEFKEAPKAEHMGQILKASSMLSLSVWTYSVGVEQIGKKAQLLGFAPSAASILLSLLTNNPL